MASMLNLWRFSIADIALIQRGTHAHTVNDNCSNTLTIKIPKAKKKKKRIPHILLDCMRRRTLLAEFIPVKPISSLSHRQGCRHAASGPFIVSVIASFAQERSREEISGINTTVEEEWAGTCGGRGRSERR